MRNKTIRVACAAAAMLIMAGPARADEGPAGLKKSLDAAKITAAQAVDAARKAVAGGTAVKVEIDEADGKVVFIVKFIVGDIVKAAAIDAATGKVTEIKDVEMTAERKAAVAEIKPLLAAAKSDPVKAADAAVANLAGGRVVQVEPDVKDGKLFYNVYLLAGDKLMEAAVDAATGTVGRIEQAKEEDEEEGDEDEARAIDFDKDAAGKLPEGWKAEGTNQKGPVATWQVIADPTAPSKPNALALTSSTHGSGSTYNICWTDRVRFHDGSIELSIKPNSGKEDQGGGPIWRVKDSNNYYICRANPLESNFRVYYVKDGKRTQLASAKTDIPSGKWHTIKIEQHATHIACYLDGQKLLEADDNTLPDAGGIGLWTKSDAASCFDNIKVTASGGQEPERKDAGKEKDEDNDNDND